MFPSLAGSSFVLNRPYAKGAVVLRMERIRPAWSCCMVVCIGSLALRIRDEHLHEEPCLGIVLKHEVLLPRRWS